MGTTNLGRLERVDLREVWESEPADFTPWLALPENLKLLGDAIGIDLELEAQEKSVGPFRADILCKDTASDAWVLIENQLEPTDHTHLGQLMTYAAGLKAVTIVWIARQFTEEHRAALDWLNEITDERFMFFGLEVELWKIANSPVAPKFNVVCQPNDWSKTVAEGAAQIERGQLSEAERLQLEFWIEFRKLVQAHATRIKASKPSAKHWMSIALGTSGFYLSAVASLKDSESRSYDTNELRAEVVIVGQESKVRFEALDAMKADIEREIGEPMTWHNPPTKGMCRIWVRRSADLENRDQWPAYHQWLLENLEKLHKAFAQRVRQVSMAASDAE